MNKNIIKIVALALAVSGATTLTPTGLNLGAKVVYADSTTNSSDLSSLKLQSDSGSTIRLYDSNDYDSNSRIEPEDVAAGTTYYAKTSAKTVKVKIDGVDDTFVRIFDGDSDSTKGRDVSRNIGLDSGSNRIIVRVYNQDPGDSPRFDDDGDKITDYTLKVKCTADDSDSSDSDSSDSSDNNDEIYLDDLTLTNSDGDDVGIDFDENKTSYNVTVKDDINYLKVAAEPEDDSYEVKINDSTVDEDKNYQKKVNLDEGQNKIVVKITDDDDDERDYTINVTRGNSSSTNTTTNTTTNTSSDTTTSADTTNNANGWSIQNGKVYYLDSTGNKKTGWLAIGSDWYYLGSDGARETGWQNVNGTWYHMDQDGKMQTGWFKDWNGTWYYLNQDSNGSKGAMLHDTYVGGYRLGSDGAWVK